MAGPWGPTGTVVFSDSSKENSTATVTGGNRTIVANFRKEVVSFVSVATMDFETAYSTWPHSASDISIWGSYLYVAGRRWDAGSESVVRRFNISTPTAPASGGNDYEYLSGVNPNIDADGTYLLRWHEQHHLQDRTVRFPGYHRIRGGWEQ